MSDLESITRDEPFDAVGEDFHDESGQLLDRLNENLLQLDEWVQGDSVIEDMCRLLQSAGVEQQSSQADTEQTSSKVPDERGGESPPSASEDTAKDQS